MHFAALFFSVLLAAAQTQDSSLDRARALGKEAQTSYDLGHYQQALKQYEELYQLKPVAAVLFNVAQCHRKLGQLHEAANLYRSFLVHAEPESREATKAQELLAQVEEALNQQEAVAKAAPQGTAPLSAAKAEARPAATGWPPPPSVVYLPQQLPPPPPPSHKTAYVLGGTAVAALAAGLILGLSAKNAASSLTSSMHTNAEANALADTHERDAHLADLFFIGAGALALGTVIAW